MLCKLKSMVEPVADERVREQAAVTGRRREVLSLLQNATEPLTIAEIARRVGVHANTARFHLEALVERGRVERVEPAAAPDDPGTAQTGTPGPGRPALLFRALPGMDPEGPRNYQLLAGVLAGSIAGLPEATARAVDSGRAWGRQLARAQAPTGADPTDRLVEILDELGFAPDRRTGTEQIRLRHCAFLELVPEQSGVICPVHLGLMTGAMEVLSDDLTVDGLEPFVEPDLCVAHLGLSRPGQSLPSEPGPQSNQATPRLSPPATESVQNTESVQKH